jgi:hypothetical protein
MRMNMPPIEQIGGIFSFADCAVLNVLTHCLLVQ